MVNPMKGNFIAAGLYPANSMGRRIRLLVVEEKDPLSVGCDDVKCRYTYNEIGLAALGVVQKYLFTLRAGQFATLWVKKNLRNS